MNDLKIHQFIQAVDEDGSRVDELQKVLDGVQAEVRHDDGQLRIQLKCPNVSF